MATNEASLARSSGLRTKHFTFTMSTQPELFVADTALLAVTEFTALTLQHTGGVRNSYPQTPVIRVIQGVPDVFSIRVRVKGLDQFGQVREETTPAIPIAAKTNTFVYMASVFSIVTSASYTCTNPSDGATISLGNRQDFAKTVDGSNDHFAPLNHGFASPLFLSTELYRSGQVVTSRGDPNQVILNVENLNNNEVWRINAANVLLGSNVAGWFGSLDKIGITGLANIKLLDNTTSPTVTTAHHLTIYGSVSTQYLGQINNTYGVL